MQLKPLNKYLRINVEPTVVSTIGSPPLTHPLIIRSVPTNHGRRRVALFLTPDDRRYRALLIRYINPLKYWLKNILDKDNECIFSVLGLNNGND